MSPSRRRGRRVPPRSRGAGPAMPPGASSPLPGPARPSSPPAGGPGPGAPSTTGVDGAEGQADAVAFSGRPSRSANRAAKRASSGRPPAGTPRRPAKRSSGTWAVLGLAGVAALVGAGVVAFGNPFGTAAPSASPRGSSAARDCPTTPPAALPAGETRTVTIETELGDIVMDIDGALAPNATGNFVALATCGFYDGVVFHRLVPGFVIQGGDPEGTGRGGPGYSIQDDALTTDYRRGTVAMARSEGPNTQGSQFFIVLADDADATLKSSQYPYAIMGEVTAGMDVVDEIAAMPNSGANSGNQALEPVEMISVTVEGGPSPSASPGASSSAAPVASDAPTQ